MNNVEILLPKLPYKVMLARRNIARPLASIEDKCVDNLNLSKPEGPLGNIKKIKISLEKGRKLGMISDH